MKFIFRIIFLGGLVIRSKAIPIPLEGKPFQSSAPIIWAATNRFPESIFIFKSCPENLSAKTISNAMAFGSFKLINKTRSSDNSTVRFQDYPQMERMTRFLIVSPTNGTIKYYNRMTDKPLGQNVPDYLSAKKLATNIFSLLGGQLDLLSLRSLARMEETSTLFKKRGGEEIGKVISAQGLIIPYELDGIRVFGPSFSVRFGSEGKISMLDADLRKFERWQNRKTLSKDAVIESIKSGRAVTPNPEIRQFTANKLTVLSATVFYSGERENTFQEFVYPFIQLKVVAEITGAENYSFTVECPIVNNE